MLSLTVLNMYPYVIHQGSVASLQSKEKEMSTQQRFIILVPLSRFCLNEWLYLKRRLQLIALIYLLQHSMESVKHNVIFSQFVREIVTQSMQSQMNSANTLCLFTFFPHIFSHFLKGSLNAQLANLYYSMRLVSCGFKTKCFAGR